MVHYASKSGSGDKVTFKDVVIEEQDATAGNGLKAKSMTLGGLAMTKDGNRDSTHPGSFHSRFRRRF